MSVRSFLAAAAVFAWTGGSAVAADVIAPPAVVSAAPVGVGEVPGCATCVHGAVRGSCPTCGGKFFSWGYGHKKTQCPATLCPGSCFGYFQTQWRKWDEVCPYPYVGISDAPRPGDLAPPRPIDPKMPDPKKLGGSAGGNYSSYFPAAPQNKFAP